MADLPGAWIDYPIIGYDVGAGEYLILKEQGLPARALRIGGRYLHMGDARYEIDVTWWEGSPVARCDARRDGHDCFCPLWPGHDGPHLPCWDHVVETVGEFTIEGMRRMR